MCADGPLRGDAASPGEAAPAPEPGRFVDVPAPPGTRFGPVRHFAEIDSTNRYLLDEGRAGAPEGMVAVADYQHAGRGRLGRRWEAPPGSNLLASVMLRPALAVGELHLCTVAVALAAAVACERGAGVVPDLKWPNDLMVRGRKLGGILAEALPGPDHGTTVVVGLGLNVLWPPPDTIGGDALPTEPGPPGTPDDPGDAPDGDEAASDGDEERRALLWAATSIGREATSRTPPEPLVMLGLILEELEPRLADIAVEAGRRRLTAEYRRRCTTVGRAVQVSLPDEVFTGTAADITPEGHLMVDVGMCLRTVAAGDVVHLRDPS